jgi:hypothetical protein
MATARSIEAKISRLRREIAQIDASFYEANKANDRDLYAGMLERKRDDMVRSAVLQLHTAIEDVLTGLITCRILGTRPDERRLAENQSVPAVLTAAAHAPQTATRPRRQAA